MHTPVEKIEAACAAFMTLFPGAVRGGRLEANGLPQGVVPEGQILARGDDRWKRETERREWFVVAKDGWLFFFRICTAMEGSGYDEFAACFRAEPHTHDNVVELMRVFQRSTVDT